MNNQTIIVTIGKPDWTMNALHIACPLARGSGKGLLVLRMVPVHNPSLLGTNGDMWNCTCREQAAIDQYASTVEDYGVPPTMVTCQYVNLLNGIVDAAGQLNAGVLFFSYPDTRIAYWRKWQIRQLRHRLATIRCQLYTLESPAELSAAQEWLNTSIPIRI